MTKTRCLIVCIALAIVVFPVFSDGFDQTLPEEVSMLVDEVAAMVKEAVPHSRQLSSLVAVRGVELEAGVPPFGELFAMTVSMRLANSGEPGLRIQAHLPVDSYLADFPSYGAEGLAESGFETPPDYVVIGETFIAEEMLHLLFQLIDVRSETIVVGLERSLPMSQWFFDLLGTPNFGDEMAYAEPDIFEPDSIDNPLEVGPNDVVSDRTLSSPGDEDWFLVSADGVDGKAILTAYTSGELDTYIEVFGPDNPDLYLDENDDGDNANAMISALVGSGQKLWVMVRGYDESIVGSYSFHTEIRNFEGDPLEPNDSLEEARQIMVGYEPVSSYIMPSDDEDWYYIDMGEIPGPNTILSVETLGDLDTYLDLYDSAGNEMISNDDGGEGDNARIDLFIEEPGRFYVRVIHYDGSDQGEYQIFADLVQATPDQYEPDDSKSEAGQISIDGRQQDRNFTPADDHDWSTFSLSETKTVEIRTEGDVDTYIKLFDHLGNMIAEDDDGGGDYNALIDKMLQRGQYYIRIHQVEGDSVFGASYTVSITAR